MADVTRDAIEVSIGDNKISTSEDLIKRFDNMLSNVANMFEKNGPIYSTWIYFQLGNKSPIVFNTATTQKDRNLIASLDIDKGNSGCANTFTLTVRYDPFDNGQKSLTDKLEQLDDYVADAMDADWDTDESKLQGVLQYGYNGTGNNDNKLVTPKYKFLLTKATSNVKYDSGIGEYTFEGVSSIASDCDYSDAKFDEIKGWKPIDIVAWVLYYYYGSPNKKHDGVSGGEPREDAANYAYNIDIPSSILDDQPEEIDVPSQTGMTPWQYCMKILSENPLLKSNKDSGNYDDLTTMNYDEIPSYYMYIDDIDGGTIHIVHNTPKESDKNNKLSYVFTWSLQQRNIIMDWKPEADLYQYIIKKAHYKRIKQDYDSGGMDLSNPDTIENITDSVSGLEVTRREQLAMMQQDDILELYDAEMTIAGIPADAPLCAELQVIPRVLETPSRTAGIYIIKGCNDNISTDGRYTTTLKLFRTRKIGEKEWETQNKETSVQQQAQKTVAENYNGGRRRIFFWRTEEVVPLVAAVAGGGVR